MDYTLVTITDSKYLPAVYVLALSVKFHKVDARFNILGVGLSEQEKAYFNQFENVRVFDADLSNMRNPTTRKGEAILTAEGDGAAYITLLDADSVVTGDITPYLSVKDADMAVYWKLPEDDGACFASKYGPDDVWGTVPRAILERWQKDVGERETPGITSTASANSLTVHRDRLDFVRKWQEQMLAILPARNTKYAHDWSSFAYSQLDESVLNSLLAFSHDVPRLTRGELDLHPDAMVYHLGPFPKFHKVFPVRNLKYYEQIVALIRWAEQNGYQVPPLPWTFKRQNRPWVYAGAVVYEILNWVKSKIRRIPYAKALYMRLKGLGRR